MTRCQKKRDSTPRSPIRDGAFRNCPFELSATRPPRESSFFARGDRRFESRFLRHRVCRRGVELCRREPGHGHRQPVSVFADLLDVVRGLPLRLWSSRGPRKGLMAGATGGMLSNPKRQSVEERESRDQ